MNIEEIERIFQAKLIHFNCRNSPQCKCFMSEVPGVKCRELKAAAAAILEAMKPEWYYPEKELPEGKQQVWIIVGGFTKPILAECRHYHVAGHKPHIIFVTNGGAEYSQYEIICWTLAIIPQPPQ